MSTLVSNVLSQELLAWISKNRLTFLLVVLAAGNVYQYVDRSNHDAQCEADKKALNEQVQKIISDDVDRERRRSEKLEFLIQNFPKSSDNGNANPNASKQSNDK